MRAILTVALLFAMQASIVACAPTNVAASGDACPDVASVRAIPFKDQKGVDEAYDSLRFRDECETVLIKSLEVARLMPDPRQMPPDARFSVADAALFILLRRREIALEAVVPENVANLMKEQGVYAYFDFVSTASGRAWVAAQARRLVAD